jgi:hypothetical protein
VINPLRSEREAFRFLLWSLAVIGSIMVVVLLARAIF